MHIDDGTIQMKRLHIKFRTKLIISHLTIASIPLCILLTVCTLFSVRVLTQLKVSHMAEISNILISNLNTIYEDVCNSCQVVADNMSIQSYLQNDYSSLPALYSADLTASLELTSFAKQNKNLSGLYVIGSNQLELKSINISFLKKSFLDETWFHQIITQDGFVIFPPHENSYVVKTVDESYITVGLTIYDKSSGKKCGAVLADVDTEIIYHLLDTTSEIAAFLIVDTDNKVLLESNHSINLDDTMDWTPYLNHTSDDTINIRSRQYRIWTDEIFDGKWKLISISDVTSIKMQWFGIFIPIIITTICIILLIFLISYYYSRRMLAPLMELRDSMRDIQSGDLCVEVSSHRTDEIGELCNAFNDMVYEIRSLTDRVYKSQELLRESQLKALQSQINPHFLYNSLDSVIWLMRLKRQDEAVTMLSALSKLFRIALSRGNDLIMVSEEISHVQNYLVIQSIRYKQKLNYTVNCSEDARCCITPKLILQPLVENCIYHAYAPEQKPVMVNINVELYDENVIFSVSDDGKGMDESHINQLRHCLDLNSSHDNSHGYGLKNIYTRLTMYFGENCSFNIESVQGKGTTVIIRIPKIIEKEDIESFMG